MTKQKDSIDFDKVKLKVGDTGITIGAVLKSDGSTSNLKTGAWRSMRPVVDFEKCTGCGICWSLCPEGCITKRDDGKFKMDMDYCKGCGIRRPKRKCAFSFPCREPR